MSVKILIFVILSFIAGAGFIAAGIYFSSQKFLNKLNDCDGQNTEISQKRNAFRAKGTGIVSLSVGTITIFFAIMLILFPSIASGLALTYIILLIFAFAALVVIYK